MKTQADWSVRESGLRAPIGLTLLMLAMFAYGGLAAEPPAEPAQAAVESPAESAPIPELAPPLVDAPSSTTPPVRRDPTQPSEQMRAVLGQGRTTAAPGLQPKLPALRIKGRVASSEGHILVLLQVGQQLERVSADTQWTTDDGLTLSVISVSLSELQLQIQPLNRTVTLR